MADAPTSSILVRQDSLTIPRAAGSPGAVEGVRLSRKLATKPAFLPLVVRETRRGLGVDDAAGLLDYIKSAARTSWHMCGTCKMGVEESAVVDPQLKVPGIAGLRVVDSSIFPTIPSSNTNFLSIAVGEKGVDLVLASARM